MSLWHETIGTGPDLVLLHGWGMNAGVWQSLLPGLREGFRVTLIDLPGHGKSEPLPGGAEAWADACLEVAPARAAWIGWSLGGMLALQAGLLAPHHIERLCLVASTPCFVQRDDWRCAMPSAVFQQFAQALIEDPATTLKRFLGLQVKGVEDARTVLRTLHTALAGRPPASADGLSTGLQILLETDLRDRLAELRVTSRWLFGGRDTLVPREAMESIGHYLPSAGLEEVIEPAGHAPFLSHPHRCLAWLETCCG